MNIIKPKKLQKGDTIGIIAPSGNVYEEKIYKGKSYLENLGYKIILGNNLFNKDRYMAGNDNQRIEDLEQAFKNPSIDAIICARGGYGAIRIINKINYEIIKKNPKIFCGYSDISALSAAIYKNTGLITFSGPMIQPDFQPDRINDFTISNFFNTTSSNTKVITPEIKEVIKNGEAKGVLFGGNLATITSLCGSDIFPDKDFIFFAEDLNEPSYKIDRCFRQLINTKTFRQNVKGLILGEFLDCENPKYLKELFEEISNELNIPTFGGYNISHSNKKLTIPYGAEAIINEKQIIIDY